VKAALSGAARRIRNGVKLLRRLLAGKQKRC
jgi:hypothetical protein